MGKFMKKVSAAFLAAAVCVSALVGCGSQKIDGTKAVMTVGDEKVPLGTAAFLARYQQAQIYQLYAMYLGQTSNIFSQELEEGKTYADDIKEDVIEDLTDMVILRQHMADYKVELTDEEKQAILDVGQAYEEKNSQEVRDKIGAKREHVSLAAELQLVKSKMMEAMAGDIDENVTEEESLQSSVTYVTVTKSTKSEDTSSDTSEDTSADESTTSTASTASTESTSSDDSAIDDENAVKKANAGILIEKITSAEDPAAADMDALAKEVDSSWSASKGTFTTKKTDDTELPAEVVEAAKSLKDGEVAKEVAESDTAYYVVRMDKVNDEEETEKKKEDILTERKQTNYDDKLAAWKEATKVSVDEGVWSAVVLSDKVPFDFATESTDSSTTESADSSAAESTDTSKAESTDSSVTESTDTSKAESADSSVAESTMSSVAERVDSSVAESTASSVAESTDSSVAESADSSVAESTASTEAE